MNVCVCAKDRHREGERQRGGMDSRRPLESDEDLRAREATSSLISPTVEASSLPDTARTPDRGGPGIVSRGSCRVLEIDIDSH